MVATGSLPDWMFERHRLVLQELRRGRVTPSLLESRLRISDGSAILADLVEAGYVTELEDAGLYELVTDPLEKRAWFHLICETCSHRQEITLPAAQIDRHLDAAVSVCCPACGETRTHRSASVSPP